MKRTIYVLAILIVGLTACKSNKKQSDVILRADSISRQKELNFKFSVDSIDCYYDLKITEIQKKKHQYQAKIKLFEKIGIRLRRENVRLLKLQANALKKFDFENKVVAIRLLMINNNNQIINNTEIEILINNCISANADIQLMNIDRYFAVQKLDGR
ncbi:MAG: hypothetical protein JWL92_373 [Candidatus Nomurabacteria bacterium]|nr:hypothetical protein [Candidatus Nomurabacteria bacterium]